MRANGGYLTAADLAAHRSEWVDPVSTNYRGYDVWELPPNTQGVAALQMLNILEAYDLKSMGFGSADYLHLFIEAKKLAFEDRARFYADPEFAKIPLKGLLSKDYAAKRRALIKPDRAALEYPADPKALDQSDTIYMTVADSAGNMVSLIQSNYRGMGSGMTPTGCGFILQDRGELFSLEDGHANVYAPGKRPFHTIIPAFVTKDGKPWLSFGVMGGGMQPQGHVQIIVNLIDFGMNLQEAGDAPRARHEGSSEPTDEVMKDGGEVVLEVGGVTRDRQGARSPRTQGDGGQRRGLWRLPGHPAECRRRVLRRLRVTQGRRRARVTERVCRREPCRALAGYSPWLAPVARSARALFTDCESSG